MDPVLSRLGGGVTIQRLEKPKASPQKDNATVEKQKDIPQDPTSGTEDSGDEFPPIPTLKRNHELNLPSTVSVKKMKLDDVHLERKPSDDIILNNFSETEISDYDTESELDESGNELDDLAAHEVLNQKVLEKVAEESEMGKEDSEEDEGSNSDSFFEKLVEQAEVPASSSTSPPIQPKQEPEDDYEVDIKEKLKEMGEISFETVKKGEKSVKKAEAPPENEVVVTPAKKFGADGEELPPNLPKGIALRRNIREVMDETKLDESTLAAQRQEAERLRRVQEQQRLLRELQRQAALERNQQKVMEMLKGGSAAHRFPKAGSSSRIGNTVLVKLPNGQTKPMTRLPKRPFELLRVPKSSVPHPPYPGYKGPRAMLQHPKPKGTELTPSVSIAPVSKKFMPPMQQRHSDSDSEGEDMKKYMIETQMRHGMKSESPIGGRPPVQTIDISSDDDCVVVSEPECEDEEPDQDDPANSGMHTNDEFNQPDEQGRVLVNVGHPEEEPDVFVAPQISRIIKPHQIGGVRFLYDNVVESINRFGSSSGFGCILAHSMGLGKTLQIVTFSDVFLRYTPAKTILCIMPINTLQNWMAEYNMWLPTGENAPNSPLNAHGEVRPRNFNLHVLNDSHRTLVARAAVIREWRAKGGVLLIGYEQFRLLSMRKFPKSRSKKAMSMEEGPPEDTKNKMLFDEVQAALVSPGPDLVICDEGHRIKNSHASISQALKQMETKRRVVLTGYPLQNNLMEYWCMVDFVRPNYLGTKTEFCNMFERPIMNGQCIDSTEADIKLMRYRAHVLHSLLLGFVQRRSHTVLQTALPQKEEYVLLIRMTPFQRTLYETFMNAVVRTQATPNPLKAFAVCLKIWNHPDVLYNFLKKRAGGEAVDIDLEEVGNVLVNNKEKPKRGPGKPRKTPAAKGKNGKPAASVTPYNSQTDATPSASATTSTAGPLTSFANAIPSHTSMNFNQTDRSTFPNFTDNPYYEQEFDQNAQFPSTFPSANSNFNQNFQSPMHFNSDSNVSDASRDQKSILNLDNQTSTTTTNNLANLPSGISLTPVSSKPKESPSSGGGGGGGGGVSLTPLTNTTSNALASLQNMQNDSTYMEIGQMDNNQENCFGQTKNQEKTFTGDKANQQQLPSFNHFDQNNFWNQDGCFEPNYFGMGNTSNSWIKKEDGKTNLVSPKSEASNESKPKINIISDIKIPPPMTPNPGKKINIISDIKIEVKKEEVDVIKSEIKTESRCDVTEMKDEVKSELKSEVKAEENPFMKMSALSLKDSKEDSGIPYDWAIELLKNYVPGCIENSAKFEILFCIITESILLGDRLLLFSQSLITLDLIEQFLQARQVPGETVSWARNVSYYRLDGSTSALEREKLINEFNSNPKIYLFLVSTRAGSLGINLIGANRVVVLDASWNPCHDTQAVCRVYRYGQRKPCFVYRLVVDNCLEKKIYDRQINKQGMSDRVVDECNPDAHLTMKDVSTLCWDEKKDEGEPKDWSHVKDNYIDVVLQKVLEKHGLDLNKEPFQHESLLVDRKEKQLSSQEKRLAKKGYEREKQAARQPAYSLLGGVRGHRPVASVRPMQQGERPSRWIPAEHWQRQGMTAQEMTLPLDVVIPTNQPEKGNIVLKAGQKVLVLKSPKGVYMQLESGKIVAIKTAIKAKEKHDEGGMDPTKALKLPPLPILPPSIKATPHMAGQKRNPVKPFMPGTAKFGVQSVQKSVPNLVSRIKSITKKMESVSSGNDVKTKKNVDIGSEIAKSLRRDESMPAASSSSDEEHLHPHVDPGTPEKSKPSAAAKPSAESPDDEIQKRISLLKKNISIQRVSNQQPLAGGKAAPSATAAKQMQAPVMMAAPPKIPRNIGRDEDSSDDSLRNSIGEEGGTAFQDTLDSITSAFQATGDEHHFEDEDEDDVSDASEPGAELLEEEEPEEHAVSKHHHHHQMHEQSEASDHSDDVTYVSDQSGYDNGGGGSQQQQQQQQYQTQQQGPPQSATAEHPAVKAEGQEYGGYNYNYGYNVPYHGHPPPQGYGYPAAQHPPPYDMMTGYSHPTAQQPPPPHVPPPPPQYNYSYGAYPPPPPQPHYPPPPPPPTATGYDYNAPPPTAQPMYPPAYHAPYPPPQPQPQYPQGGMYPPPPPTAAPAYAGEYQQYHQQPTQPQQSQTPQQQQQYYQNT